MVCTSCQKLKFSLRRRKSKLLPKVELLLCDECYTARREPRFAIIVVGRQKGLETVAEYIRNRRYVGDDITAREML